jgi:hypothetical protein
MLCATFRQLVSMHSRKVFLCFAVVAYVCLASHSAPESSTWPPFSFKLNLTQPANATLLTVAMPSGASQLNLTFDSAHFATNVSYIVLLAPTNAASLRQASANNPTVASSVWQGREATPFGDRFVIHPTTAVPGRILASCSAVGSSLLCTLPVNVTGSLLQLYVGWGVPIMGDPSALAIRSLIKSVPLLAAAGLPLSLTFPLPAFDPLSAHHFKANDNFLRVVPTGWANDDSSKFDLLAEDTSSGASVLLPVAQVPDPIFLGGALAPFYGQLKVFVGDPTGLQVLPCALQTYTPTWMICVPGAPNPDLGLALLMPFSLWDTSSLTVARSPILYSYPAQPALYNISGCGPPGTDDTTGISVMATNCPTVGGLLLTMTGKNIIPPFAVTINGQFPCALDAASFALAKSSNYTMFTCTLPQATGQFLTVEINSGGFKQPFPNSLSYALPYIASISGCNATLGFGIVECNRYGGNVVSLFGNQFGIKGVRVLIGGQLCLPVSSSENLVRCRLIAGNARFMGMIVLQATGGMTITSDAVRTASTAVLQPGVVWVCFSVVSPAPRRR